MRLKGAETRYIVPFALELAQDYHKWEQSATSARMYSLMQFLLTFYYSMGVTPFVADTCAQAARNVCLIYKLLSDDSSDEKFWRIKPEFHLFLELAEYQTVEVGDPRLFWAFVDEDFVGMIGAIAHQRGGPRSANTIPQAVMQKYSVLLN